MVPVSPLKTSWLIAQGKLACIDNTSAAICPCSCSDALSETLSIVQGRIQGGALGAEASPLHF